MLGRLCQVIFSGTLLISALATSQPLLAQTQHDLEICKRPFANDPDEVIRACGTFIQSKRTVDRRSIPIKALAAIYELRALAYERKGDDTAALADFNESLRLFPTSEVYYDRGNTYFQKLGNNDQALLDYDHSIALNPREANTHLNRGNLYFAKRDYNRALADYDEAIRINPKFDLAINNRKRLQNFTAIEAHWRSYLKDIQNDFDYANWSGPPLDLYEKPK
jgi:tetratricopeptide (TPR) repeat protein